MAFVPEVEFSGALSCHVANDGRLDSAPATVTIQVTGTNHPPRINTLAASFVPNERSVYNYDIGATDPDTDDVLAYRLDRSIAGASVDRDSGLLGWNADPALVGGVRELNKACRRPVAAGVIDPEGAVGMDAFGYVADH